MKAVVQKLLTVFFSVVLILSNVAVGAQETQAETFDPEVVELLITQVNVVPEAETAVKDAATYPATYEWQDEAVFETGTDLVVGTVVVTYEDTSQELLEVDIQVVEEINDAALNDPIGTTELIVVTAGEVPEASQYIVNNVVLPAGTVYEWVEPVIFETVGEHQVATIHIIYPDGSVDEMPLLVTVEEAAGSEETQADLYTPLTVDHVITDLGLAPVASEALANLDELQAAAVVTWQDERVFNEVKTEIFENVIVTYIDGSSDMLPVLVTVRELEEETEADIYTPVAQTLTTEIGVVPLAIDAIANLDELPNDTQFAWQDEAVFEQVEQELVTIVLVSYPDGSVDELEVVVSVVDDLTPEPEASLYTPRSVTLVTTEQGVVPMAKAAIENIDELPNDATFAWEDDRVFDTVIAASFANLIVTYADGSKDTLAVPITVTEVAEATHARVIVHFVDTEGNRLLPSQIDAREIGTTYGASRVAIEGYTLDSIVGQEKGIVAKDEAKNTVTYIYRKLVNQPQLPNTGETTNLAFYGAGVLVLIVGVALLVTAYRKRRDK